MRMVLQSRDWPRAEPFVISRGVLNSEPALEVLLLDDQGLTGRGEACGVDYHDETPLSMSAQLEAVRTVIEGGVDREACLGLLPAGGARCALDAALWDVEAASTGRPLLEASAFPLLTAYTIGIRGAAFYERAAAARSMWPLLKIKVGVGDPLPALQAARAGAPRAQFIVDPNQAWSVDELKVFAPRLADLGVVLIEQPIPVGAETALHGWRSPVPLAADELIDTEADLDRAADVFQVINIKLDKAGGLTAALRLAAAAEERGFKLMIGCMAGSSLAMAPALTLAPRCAFVDLDGPLLQSEDVPHGLEYVDGYIQPPSPLLWGGGAG